METRADFSLLDIFSPLKTFNIRELVKSSFIFFIVFLLTFCKLKTYTPHDYPFTCRLGFRHDGCPLDSLGSPGQWTQAAFTLGQSWLWYNVLNLLLMFWFLPCSWCTVEQWRHTLRSVLRVMLLKWDWSHMMNPKKLWSVIGPDKTGAIQPEFLNSALNRQAVESSQRGGSLPSLCSLASFPSPVV